MKHHKTTNSDIVAGDLKPTVFSRVKNFRIKKLTRKQAFLGLVVMLGLVTIGGVLFNRFGSKNSKTTTAKDEILTQLEAVKVDSNTPPELAAATYLDLGLSYQHRNLHAQAISAFKKAQSYNANKLKSSILKGLYNSYKATGKKDEAKKTGQELIAALKSANNPLEYTTIITIAREIGDTKTADEYQQKYEAAFPKDVKESGPF